MEEYNYRYSRSPAAASRFQVATYWWDFGDDASALSTQLQEEWSCWKGEPYSPMYTVLYAAPKTCLCYLIQISTIVDPVTEVQGRKLWSSGDEVE